MLFRSVSTGLADAVRNVHELNYSAPETVVTWHDEGRPDVQPGDVVHVTAPSIGIDADLWVLSTQHTFTDEDGFSTTFTGWAGAGSALAAGNDCVNQLIFTDPVHIGDEYLSHYAVPSPSGRTISFDFTVEDNYTSLTAVCKAHGTNSYMLNGKNAESTVTRFEVWQFGEKIGEGELPVLAENLAQAYPYDPAESVTFEDGSTRDPIGYYYWSDLVIPITGSVEPGTATFKIISGYDSRASLGPYDDCEFADVYLRQCGIGSPILPTVREA